MSFLLFISLWSVYYLRHFLTKLCLQIIDFILPILYISLEYVTISILHMLCIWIFNCLFFLFYAWTIALQCPSIYQFQPHMPEYFIICILSNRVSKIHYTQECPQVSWSLCIISQYIYYYACSVQEFFYLRQYASSL